YIRYYDSSYIILFAQAGAQEARDKTALMAEEIRKRLFNMEEDELRNIEIARTVAAVRPASLKNSDFLDAFAVDWADTDAADDGAQGVPEGVSLHRLESVDVDTRRHRSVRESVEDVDVSALPDLSYAYLPLWDVRRNALTTYLCLPHGAGGKDAYE